jgi:hypothetical protein
VTAAPEPGWYPDPAGATDLFRWWDGQDWTDAISESTLAPRPPRRLPPELECGDPEIAQPEGSDPPRRSLTWRSVVALIVVIALFLSATAGIGLLIWGDSSGNAARLPVSGAGAGTRPTAYGTAPIGHLDQSSRTATIGAASLVLPDTPYVLYPDPMPIDGVLDLVFWSGATVHPRYDGKRNWSAAVLFGQVSSSLAAGDLETAGRLTMERLGRTYFDHAAEVTDVSWSDHSVDQNPGLLFSATMSYSVPNLPSRFDRVTALLVRLDDGSVVIAAASVPDDAGPELARQAAESLQTLAIR